MKKPSSFGSKSQPRPDGIGPERANLGRGSRRTTAEQGNLLCGRVGCRDARRTWTPL